ncbi:Protein of unknown function [Gryllus bimaculatus]|nr:Protein of unknown function [Gryllus bimaculatus]
MVPAAVEGMATEAAALEEMPQAGSKRKAVAVVILGSKCYENMRPLEMIEAVQCEFLEDSVSSLHPMKKILKQLLLMEVRSFFTFRQDKDAA